MDRTAEKIRDALDQPQHVYDADGNAVPPSTLLGGTAEAKARRWVEADHPRDPRGRFTDKPGGGLPGEPDWSALSPDELGAEMARAARSGDMELFQRLAAIASGGEPAKPKPAPKPRGPQIERDGSLTPGETASVNGYLHVDGNRTYNMGLRSGNVGPGVASGVADLDSAIAKHRVTNDVTVYRGIALPDGMDLSPGATISDLAYTSTAKSKDMARRFAELRSTGTSDDLDSFGVQALGGRPVVLAINVPAGFNMMPGDSSVDEFVLPRGLSFRVDRVHDDGTVEVSIAD